MSKPTSRYVEFEIAGRTVRIHGDPVTTIGVYVLTFCVFTLYDKCFELWARRKQQAA